MNDIIEVLSDPEQSRLSELEQIITQGFNHFIVVCEALAEIRDTRLYRSTHQTFDFYCKNRWNFGARRAYQLIDASEVIKQIPAEMRTKVHTERQVRAVKAVPKALRSKVVKEAIKSANGKPLTAKLITQTHHEIAPPKGGLAAQALASRAHANPQTPRDRLLAAIDQWWNSNPHLHQAAPITLLNHFRALIDQTLV